MHCPPNPLTSSSGRIIRIAEGLVVDLAVAVECPRTYPTWSVRAASRSPNLRLHRRFRDLPLTPQPGEPLRGAPNCSAGENDRVAPRQRCWSTRLVTTTPPLKHLLLDFGGPVLLTPFELIGKAQETLGHLPWRGLLFSPQRHRNPLYFQFARPSSPPRRCRKCRACEQPPGLSRAGFSPSHCKGRSNPRSPHPKKSAPRCSPPRRLRPSACASPRDRCCCSAHIGYSGWHNAMPPQRAKIREREGF